MAKNISNNGAGAVYVTMEITEGDSLKELEAVTLESNNTVGYGASGGTLFGIVAKNNGNGLATIQVSGFVDGVHTVSGATIATVGKCLAVNGAGKVVSYTEAAVVNSKAAIIPTNAVAVSVDSTAYTCSVKL